MGILYVHDGVRVTLGEGNSDDTMNLNGDMGFSVSHGAGSNETAIMEIKPPAPDFVYVHGTRVGTDESGWWYPMYLNETDAAAADALYRGLALDEGTTHPPILLVEHDGQAFYSPSAFELTAKSSLT